MLDLVERTECFKELARYESGVVCRNITFFLARGASSAQSQRKLLQCAKDVHLEVQDWMITVSKRNRALTQVFLATWAEMEEWYRAGVEHRMNRQAAREWPAYSGAFSTSYLGNARFSGTARFIGPKKVYRSSNSVHVLVPTCTDALLCCLINESSEPLTDY